MTQDEGRRSIAQSFMKKAKPISNDLRAEYKRSDFKKLERGKYYKHATASPESRNG